MKEFDFVVRHFLLLLLGMQLSVFTFGQNSEAKHYLQHEFGISTGNHSLDDSLVAPRRIAGHSTKLSYGISQITSKRKTTLKAGYEKGSFKNEYHRTKQNAFDLSLSDGFNLLTDKSRRGGVYLGYEVSTHSSYIRQLSIENSGNSYSWNSYNMVSLYQSYTYSWNKQAVFLDVSVPVVGIVYRPRAANITENGKTFDHVINTLYSNPLFSSLHNHLMVDLSLTYSLKVNNRFDISGKYNFICRKWTGENRSISQSNSFGIAFIYHRAN